MTWKIGAVTVVAIAVVFLARAYVNRRGHRELAAALAAHPTFTLLAPSPPYIPDDQNLAQWDFLKDPEPFRNQVVNTSGLGAWRSGNRYSISDPRPADDDDLIRLHAASREYPMIYFRSAKSAVMRTGNDNTQLHNVAVRLALRAERRLTAGERPVDDIVLALRLANSLTNDPLALDQRETILWQIIQPVYDGILAGAWNDSELRQLQDAFAASSAAPHFQRWRQQVVREVLNAYDNPPTGMMNIAGIAFWAAPRSPRSELPGKAKSHKAEIVRMGLDPPKSGGLYSRFEYQPGKNEFHDQLMIALRHSLGRGGFKATSAQVAVDLVVVACAVERFRLSHNKLPAWLGELAPDDLARIPNDAVNGKPFKYRMTSSGFILYSVAADGHDHGGVPESVQSLKGGGSRQISGDWVWIYKK